MVKAPQGGDGQPEQAGGSLRGAHDLGVYHREADGSAYWRAEG